MIDVKEAVQIGREFLNNIVGKDEVTNIRVEEVEFSTHEGDLVHNLWEITLSYLPANPHPLIEGEGKRLYKTLFVNATNGEVSSMKIRELV